MAGAGGPSRRSHTKSRKGCKTCKRRHIRCDENYPQCKNCSKHQVRCDYMDNPHLNSPTSPNPDRANLLWTQEIESTVDAWQRTGDFPFPDLRVYPEPQWHTFSKVELRLVHHLSSIANEMLRNRTSTLTVWTEYLPKILSLGASHQFVMQSLLAFSASHLAWISQSTETRTLASHYASAALKGLQQAIGSLSKANSDALLAASLLLQWVATDWRTWASLVSSTTTIINMMQPWKHESIFAEYLAEHGLNPPQMIMNPQGTFVTAESRREHLGIVHHLHRCLRCLQPYLHHYEQERKWVEQLLAFLERLQNSTPAQLAEEQFSQLYALRKWLFWVPISLLAVRRGDAMMLTVLSYFYATALALEPMFPDVGGALCSAFALQPLEEIIRTIDSYQAQHAYNPTVATAASSIAYPRETAAASRTRRDWSRQRSDSLGALQVTPYVDLDATTLNLSSAVNEFGTGPSLSPAAPSPLSYLSGQPSPFIDTASRASIDYGAVSSSGGYISPLVSPTAPVLPYTTQEEAYSHFASMPLGYASGDRPPRQLPLQIPHFAPSGLTLPSIMNFDAKGKGPASGPPPHA